MTGNNRTRGAEGLDRRALPARMLKAVLGVMVAVWAVRGGWWTPLTVVVVLFAIVAVLNMLVALANLILDGRMSRTIGGGR